MVSEVCLQCFLTQKGRVLYDALIYKTEEKDVYFIECDLKANITLQKHLKIYKVRRKIDISCLNQHKIYTLYNLNFLAQKNIKDINIIDGEYDQNAFPENSSNIKIYKDLYIFKDPRVAHLGFRIITKSDVNIIQSLDDIIRCKQSDSYKKLRFSLGVGEGTEDLPVGNANPLENNCDYLHGVSFHKGCYIGQELTARTYHTGVIRKRLMPLIFTKLPNNLPENNVILHNNANLGKLRGIEGNVGLALLRIKQALENKSITIGDGQATVFKPDWWPIELPKEKINIANP